jgi:uncharacterized Tic20 family protein
MNTKTNYPLTLAFIIVLIVFLLLCGGAITMTLMNEEIYKNGFFHNVSWLWMPTLIAFLLSMLLGWVLFKDKGSLPK